MTNSFHVHISNSKGLSTIQLSGDFNFYSHLQFKKAYFQTLSDPAIRSLSIDFAHVERMDTSSQGMLLILKDRVQLFGKTLTLDKPSPVVKKTFDIANFYRIFTIH